MTVRQRAAVLAALCAAAMTSCVSAPPPGTPRVVQHFRLTPYAVREECVQLSVGERLDYRYTATQPVRFAVQYRERNATIVPLQRDPSREDAGIYPAPESREYCLNWEAGAEGAFLDYRFVAHPPAAR